MKRGFTVPELLLVLVLGGLIMGALHRVVLSQNAFYRQARFTVERHEALRSTMAVLGPELRESNLSEGDAEILDSDEIRIRSSTGFGLVCGIDENRGHLALTGIQGRIDGAPTDTLQIYHSSGWRKLVIRQVDPSGRTDADCSLKSNSTPDLRVRVTGDLEGIQIGAPVRAFHSYRYHLAQAEGGWWLARSDGSGTEILTGPISEDGTGLSFSYLDADGVVTGLQSQAVYVRLTTIIDPGVGRGLSQSIRRDTLSLDLMGRNR